MFSFKKKNHLLPIVFVGMALVLILQAVWMHRSYQYTYGMLMIDTKEALVEAYRKEQTYRAPVVDIVTPGSVTIESCSKEEVLIIRKCPEPDTIVYSAPSGHSIESFINRVFVDIREHIVPMNINCLADLFAGMLHDKDVPVYFVIERFDIETGKIVDTSLLPDKRPLDMNVHAMSVLEISEKEALRAIIEMKPVIVLGRMKGTLALTISLTLLIACCLTFVYRFKPALTDVSDFEEFSAKEPEALDDAVPETDFSDNAGLDSIFNIGQYIFDPAKNDLHGYGEYIQLNKKENSILYTLCAQCGNVVERSVLLSENWGSNGVIYSRSLDTYIATLRKYLKKDSSIQIVTIKGVGYKIVCS